MILQISQSFSSCIGDTPPFQYSEGLCWKDEEVEDLNIEPWKIQWLNIQCCGGDSYVLYCIVQYLTNLGRYVGM